MAIAKMEKLSIIGLSKEKESLIEDLMRLGVVQIVSQESKLAEEKWSRIIKKDDGGKWVSKWESELAKTESALTLFDRFSQKKKPFIKERTRVTKAEFETTMEYEYEIRRKMLKLTKLARKLSQTIVKENKATITKLSLLPWKDYDIPAEDYQTKATQIWQGLLPAANDSADFLKILSEKTQFAEGQVVNTDSEQHYISIMFYEPAAEEVQSALRDLGFNRILLPITQGSVDAAIKILDEELAEVARVKSQIAEKIRTYQDFERTLQLYHDDIAMRKDCAEIRDKFLVTDSTFYLEGWFPRIGKEKVEALLSKKICHYEMTQPSKDEETPILLLNQAAVQPFEAVTKLYSLPASGGIDATPFFAFFYALFFGMMLADVAYGIIIAVATFVVNKKYHLEGMLKQMVNMFFACGLSTAFWGAMFGGFFGDLITQVSTNFFGTTVNFPTLWFNPINDPMKLLFFSLGLGLIHIFLAMGLSAYMSIRDGHPLDALFDIGFWYILILSLIGYMGGGMIPGVPASVPEICKWLAIASAVGIVATGGRDSKSIVGKLVGGLGSLYGISGYLSDVLSYSRILALGLAGGVISSVFNTLGSLAGSGIVGVIVFIIVFCIGHPYNIAINTLGSFVHSCRLQYVEFFGRFYQGGGESFKPFCENTKYVKILKEEL